MKTLHTAFELRDVNTIIDLKKMAAEVRVDAPDAPSDLLREARTRLQRRLRQLLKRGGCEVVDDPSLPRLLVTIRLRAATDCVSGNQHLVYRVGAALREIVRPDRNNKLVVPADTWHHQSIVGYVPSSSGFRAAEAAISLAALRQVRDFVGDVLNRDDEENPDDDDLDDSAFDELMDDR